MRQLKITHKITSRESLALDKYLTDIGRLELITPEEEGILSKKIREGDEDALEKLTKANLRFVVSVAKQYQNNGLSLSDLINEGNIGLMKAARRFDETKGFKFISYAVWWIRQSILQAIVEYSRLVRLPLNKINQYNKVNEAYITFIQEFEREPSMVELAEIIGISENDVTVIMAGAGKHLSTDAPISSDEGSISMIDTMSVDEDESPDMGLMEQSLRDEVKYGLSILSPREIQVLNAFYGIDMPKSLSLDEIGVICGLTRERVRQVKDRAIRRLRRSMNSSAAARSYL